MAYQKRSLRFAMFVAMAALILGAARSARAQSCTPPPSGMVGWWSGDGNANDIAGSNTGTIAGDVTFVTGNVDEAFSFPTAGAFAAYVNVGNAPSLQVSSGDFTLDAWIYPTAICDEFPGAGCSSRGIAGKMAVAPNIDGWRLFLEGPKLTFNAGGQTFNTGTHAELPNFSVTVGAWSHVALVKRGSNIELYKNGGQLFSSTPINVFYDSGSASMWIGSDPSEGNTFSGLIDEVELFNRALLSSEVQAIYNAGAAGKCKCSYAPATQPLTFVRSTGKPVTQGSQWTSCGGQGTMFIHSESVDSAQIELNGASVVVPELFAGSSVDIQLPVTLNSGTNVLRVTLASKPGATLRVSFAPQ